MRRILSFVLGVLIIMSALSPLPVLAATTEKYPEEYFSDWMLKEDLPDEVKNAPEGAYVFEYTDGYKTSVAERKTSGHVSEDGWTMESKKKVGSTGYGDWSAFPGATSDTQSDSYHTIVKNETIKAYVSHAWISSDKKSYWKSGPTAVYVSHVLIYSSKSLESSGYDFDRDSHGNIIDGSYILPARIGKNSPGKLGTVYLMRDDYKGGTLDTFVSGWNNESAWWPNGTANIYRAVTEKYQYTHIRWSDWSNVSREKVESTDSLRVQVVENAYVRYFKDMDVFDEAADTYIAKNGVIYSINREDKTATVSSYQNLDETIKSVEVTIPSTIIVDNETYTVTTIGKSAFKRCSILTKINIPASITSIDSEAFYRCIGLSEIVIPSSVKTIGEKAFYNCSTMRKAVIGNGVKTIGESAFEECEFLNKVSIGKEVEQIGAYAFAYCGQLNAIYFIGEKPEISNTAFERDGFGTKYNISIYYNSAKTSWYGIGGWKNDVGFITKLYLTQTLGYTNEADWTKYINWYVYDQGDIIYLDENGYDFQGNKYSCENGKAAITLYDEDENITRGDICIPSKVFFNTVEYEVNAIGDNLFKDCKTLARISIGDNISTIGSSAFENCENLISVTYGRGVENISSAAFKNCTSLKELYFKGEAPASFQSDSFDGVSPEAFVVRYNGNNSWSSVWNGFTVYNCDVLNAVDNTTYFRDDAGVYYTILSVEDKKAIVGKKISTTAEDPENASNTGYSGKGDIIIADFVDINGEMYMVSGLDRFAFFNSEISSISLGRFMGYGMTSEQPGIWDCTFRQSSTLKSVTVSSENKVYYSNEGVLYKYDTNLTTTPTLLMLYPIAKEGTSFTVINGVTSINQYAFTGQNNLQTVNLNGVVTVGDHAFTNCINLKTATMPSVRSVENQAFYNCSSLSAADLSQIETIGDQAFYGCASMSNVLLAGVTEIGRQAFGHCNNIKAFTVTDSSNYSSDAFGVLFETDGDNKKLLQYPAGSNATTYTLSDATVTAVEPYAFYGATNLKEINLSDSLEVIGEHAFDNCLSIKTIYIGAAVKNIGTRAFYDCLDIENFTVSPSNAYYYADGEGVLYKYARNNDGDLILGSDGSMSVDTLVCYPAALQRNAYTVMGGVTTISSGAFAKNPHLIRVVLPSTLRAMRDEVFANCTNLAEIYFKGEIPEIGDGVVDSTSETLVIYYLSSNSTWEENPLPKAIAKCTIHAYNAIEELPNNISFVNSYAVVITNSEGKTVTNSKVTANGVSATYTNGLYVFGMPKGYDETRGIAISVETAGYYTYTNTLFLDEELHLSYITIKKQSTVQGVSCENIDINTKTHSLNKWLYSSSAGGLRIGSNVKIAIQGYCDSSYIISKYAIVQNGVVIATATPGPSDANGLSKKYTFSIPGEKFIVGAKLQVCMEVWDNTENKAVDTLYSNLNISIYSQSIAIRRSDTGAGTGSVSVSGDVPMTPVALDLGKGINVTLKDKNNPVLSGMSLKLGWDNTSIKVKVKSSDEIEISISPQIMNPDKKNSLSIQGKVTLKFLDPLWLVSETSLGCAVKVKTEVGKTVLLWGIPVYVEANVSAGSSINVNMYYDTQALKMKIREVELGLEGKLGLYGGVGCQLASMGIYGSAKTNIRANINKNLNLKKWDIKGEAGLYLKVKCPKIEYEYPVISGTLVLYENGRWFPRSRGRSGVRSVANMYLAENYAITQSTADTALQTDIKTVRLSANKIAKVYMVNMNAGNYESTSVYDAYNSDKIVYQIGTLNALTGAYKWGDPVVLDDNGYNDVSFDVCYDEESGNAYISYSQTSGKIGEGTTAEIYVGMTEIKAAEWTGKEFEIMKSTNADGFITDNNIFDNVPVMTVVNGTPVLVWSSNEDNNFLGVSDYNYVDAETGEYFAYETKSNTIWYSMYDGDLWTRPEKVVDKLPTINSYSADSFGSLVFSVDPDSNPMTTDSDGNFIDDSELYQVELGDTYKFASLEPVKDQAKSVSVKTVGGTLVYTRNGVVYRYADNAKIVDTGEATLNDAVVVKDAEDEISAILFTRSVAINEDAAGDAVFGMFRDGTEWGKPVQLTKAIAEKRINSFDAAYVKNKLVIDMQYVTDSINIKIGEPAVKYELESVIYEFKNDIIVNSLKLDQESISVGGDVNVVANITNNSANMLTSVDIKVVAPDGKTEVYNDKFDVTVKPGEIADVKFVFVPKEVIEGDYSVIITTSKEVDETNNSGTLRLAYSDLAVYSKQIVLDGGYYLIAGVSNNGNTTASGTLYIAKDIKNNGSAKNANEDYLYKIQCNDIEPGHVKYYKVTLDEDFFDDDKGNGLVTLFIDNATSENEINSENNYEYVSIVDVVGDIDKTVSLSSEATPYIVDDYYAYEISRCTDDVIFEYISNGYVLTGIADVNASNYTITDNAIIFTGEYIKSLGEGEHKLTAVFANGDKLIARICTVINFANYYNVKWQVGKEIVEAGLVEVGGIPEFTGSTDKAPDDKYNYRFAGWDVDSDGIADYLPGDDLPEVTGETCYVAVYEAIEKTYSVTWDVDGRITEKQYKKGEVPVYCGSTEKESSGTTYYVFRGWDSDDDGIADVDSGEDFPAVIGSQKYTAVYKKALPITKDDFTIDLAAEKYTGKAVTKKIVSPLVEGKDYMVAYFNNISAGEATIKIEAIGNYGGVLTYTFEIRSGVYIGSTKYASLGAAIAAVPEDLTQTTITLYSDITVSSKNNILEGNNVVLDLNDCTVTSSIISGYAFDIYDGGALNIKDGSVSVEKAGGIRVQDGGICEIAGVDLIVSKNGVYNMGTVTEMANNNISAETAIYNLGVITKIASGVYTGAKRGVYNDGTIQSLCGGSFKGSVLENSVYSTDENQIVRKDNSINFTDLETGNGYITIVPETSETVIISEYCVTQLATIFDDASYIYKGVPSMVTNYRDISGYYGTGSVISMFDAESGKYVKSTNIVLLGDVNGDSVCDVIDCARVALAVNNISSLDGVYFDAANMDCNDKITVEDYSAIVNQALK